MILWGLFLQDCTQCGGNIEVDETKEAGICKYCRTAFVTEKAIKNYVTNITNNNNYAGANINMIAGDIKNYLNIVSTSLKSGNGKEAFEYANRVLEIKANCCEAWLIKMKALEYMGTIGDPRISEVISCGKNAIDTAPETKKEVVKGKVYSYYLTRSLALLRITTNRINDVEQVKQTHQTFAVVNVFEAASRTQRADSGTVNLMEELSNNALLLKLSVPKEEIISKEGYQKIVKELAEQYVAYSKGLTNRYAIYGVKLLNTAVDSRRKVLELYKEGLKEDIKDSISVNEINNESPNSGCYIATCVYGSYDCPEVWTLRRFRDYTLDVTWYGRLFIKCYYAISPTLVEWFGKKQWFKKFWKPKLDKMVFNLKEKGIEDTYYNDKY